MNTHRAGPSSGTGWGFVWGWTWGHVVEGQLSGAAAGVLGRDVAIDGTDSGGSVTGGREAAERAQ